MFLRLMSADCCATDCVCCWERETGGLHDFFVHLSFQWAKHLLLHSSNVADQKLMNIFRKFPLLIGDDEFPSPNQMGRDDLAHVSHRTRVSLNFVHQTIQTTEPSQAAQWRDTMLVKKFLVF